MKTRIISFCLSAILILGVLSQTAIGAEGPDSAEYPPTSQDDSSYQDAPEYSDSTETDNTSELGEDETSEEENDPVKPHLPAVDLNRLLNTEEHSAYVQGSEDFVKPDGPLTRAEAATMIYSLLREQPQELKATFPDVSETDWFYRPVLTLATLGAISGTPDGEYKPRNNITRAEFVTILSAFFPMSEGNIVFPDVAEDYWASQQIASAAAKGWISGYPDGTFGPSDNIKRCEAVKILNNALGRKPDKEAIDGSGATKKILRFLDLPFTHWAYYDIMEASVDHSYLVHDDSTEEWGEYIVPASQHQTGYHLIDGQLYKVDKNGHFVRNAQDGVLQFDNLGRYTTGNAELDVKLTNLVQTYSIDGLSLKDNFYRLYKYVCNNFRYIGRGNMADGASGWEVTKALQMINTRGGNCYNYAALTAMLARKMGYQAVGISGMAYLPWNRSYIHHGWVEISLGGVTYICDAQQEGDAAPNRGYKWDLFFKRYSDIPKTPYPRYMKSGNRLN